LESINEEDMSDNFVYAPQTERESYVSEADQAAQANEFVAVTNNKNKNK
jgi:hypothetical protein